MNNYQFSISPGGVPVPSKQTCLCRLREPKPVLFTHCCARYLSELAIAPTVQALMRSRYTAYALGGKHPDLAGEMLRYLQATWHPDYLPADLSVSPMQWTGLKVLEAKETGDAGTVNFVAFFKEGGKTERLAERSQFVRVNGAWLYTTGLVEE